MAPTTVHAEVITAFPVILECQCCPDSSWDLSENTVWLPFYQTLFQASWPVPAYISAHSLNGASLVLPQMNLTYFSYGPNDDTQTYYF